MKKLIILLLLGVACQSQPELEGKYSYHWEEMGYCEIWVDQHDNMLFYNDSIDAIWFFEYKYHDGIYALSNYTNDIVDTMLVEEGPNNEIKVKLDGQEFTLSRITAEIDNISTMSEDAINLDIKSRILR